MKIKRPFKLLMLIGLIFSTLFLIIIWSVAGKIIHPPTARLSKSHSHYFDPSEDHAIVIEKRSFLAGKVPTLIVRPAPDQPLQDRGQKIRQELQAQGISLPPYGTETGLLVLLHGRSGCKELLLPIAERYCAVGLVCLIPNLSNHGESTLDTLHYGSSDFEKKLPGELAREAAISLQLEHLPKSLWGMSMGGSFAIHSAATDTQLWHRLVIISTFDELESIIEGRLRTKVGPAAPVILPILRKIISIRNGPDLSKVRPIDQAPEITCPTLIVHGTHDELIPESRSHELFDALQTQKSYLSVPGANHANVLITDVPVYATTAAWLLQRDK